MGKCVPNVRDAFETWLVMIEVRLFATLRDNRGKVIYLPWRQGMNAGEIISALEIKPDDAAIFLVNGVQSTFDKPINADDIVAIFPPIGGG